MTEQQQPPPPEFEKYREQFLNFLLKYPVFTYALLFLCCGTSLVLTLDQLAEGHSEQAWDPAIYCAICLGISLLLHQELKDQKSKNNQKESPPPDKKT